jgi:hypothetical protein
MLESGIVNSSTEFSINICGKYKDYYGNSKLKKFDLTLETAINSIYNIKKLIRKYEKQNPTLGYIHSEKIEVLKHCEEKLREYLRVRFRVAEIVEEVSTIYDDEADFYGIVI